MGFFAPCSAAMSRIVVGQFGEEQRLPVVVAAVRKERVKSLLPGGIGHLVDDVEIGNAILAHRRHLFLRRFDAAGVAESDRACVLAGGWVDP